MSNEGSGPSYEEIVEAARLAREVADHTRRKLEAGERMAEAAIEAELQLEWLDEKEPRGTTAAVLTRLRAALRAWKEAGK